MNIEKVIKEIKEVNESGSAEEKAILWNGILHLDIPKVKRATRRNCRSIEDVSKQIEHIIQIAS